MATADILTGQFVILDQTPASIGDRIIARIIDMMVRVAYVIVALVFFTWVPSDGDDDFWSLMLVLLVGLPLVLYTFLCELLFNGQTIGKMVMKIRTVSVDGSCPTMGSLFLRWLLSNMAFSPRHRQRCAVAGGLVLANRMASGAGSIPVTAR